MENIVYYITLYFFVIIIRFFKLKKELKTKFTEKWYETFYGSLEIVYTASGFVIALLLNVTKAWIAAVIVLYLLIVVFSAFLEMSNDEEFKPKNKAWLHVTITLIMIVSTIVSYIYVIPKVDINGNPTNTSKEQKKMREFLVYVPYKDVSIYQYINSNKLEGKYFYFNLKVKCFTKDSAIILVKEKIEKDTLIKPIYTNKKNTENLIETNYDKAIILETM